LLQKPSQPKEMTNQVHLESKQPDEEAEDLSAQGVIMEDPEAEN